MPAVTRLIGWLHVGEDKLGPITFEVVEEVEVNANGPQAMRWGGTFTLDDDLAHRVAFAGRIKIEFDHSGLHDIVTTDVEGGNYVTFIGFGNPPHRHQ